MYKSNTCAVQSLSFFPNFALNLQQLNKPKNLILLMKDLLKRPYSKHNIHNKRYGVSSGPKVINRNGHNVFRSSRARN